MKPKRSDGLVRTVAAAAQNRRTTSRYIFLLHGFWYPVSRIPDTGVILLLIHQYSVLQPQSFIGLGNITMSPPTIACSNGYNSLYTHLLSVHWAWSVAGARRPCFSSRQGGRLLSAHSIICPAWCHLCPPTLAVDPDMGSARWVMNQLFASWGCPSWAGSKTHLVQARCSS